ncbi:MAG: endonuclease/exonuclease/phosphatase family protein [Anaerolineales bacterium]|nr:endonuclease/exonuclease/phosphatase family protein [Anaerolineales bacterium]
MVYPLEGEKKRFFFAQASALLIAALLLSILGWQLSFSAVAQSITLIPICRIQGKGFSSDWKGQFVYVQGIVTADFDQKRGLIALQQPSCDQDPKTSDALWVYLSPKADIVRKGDQIQVGGKVVESFGRTQIESNYSQITLLTTDNPMPEAVELIPPQWDTQANLYYEGREAMIVSVSLANVIGPTDSYETTWLMPTVMDVTRLFYDDPRGTGGVFAIDAGGDYELSPALKVGDQVANVFGVLDEAYEAYRVYLLEEPTILESPFWGYPQAPVVSAPNAFRMATFNLSNLFDTEDDPQVNDTILSKAEYQRRLRKRALVLHEVLGEPEVVALQEAENERVLRDLIDQPEITAPYEIIWEETPDLRGLDVALLYRSDRLRVMDVRQEQGCTDLVDGLGPDGNQNVKVPENRPTCDLDGDGNLDGNRLFLRPPLVVKIEMKELHGVGEHPQFVVIVNHWKSKVEDSPWMLYTLPRRIKEAEFTADLILRLNMEFPTTPLLLAGDFNDFPTSLPLQKLLATGIVDLTQTLPAEQRYSYTYRGISQNIDYLLLEANKGLQVAQVTPLHFNADYPYSWISRDDTPIRASDHDVWQATFYFPYQSFLPLTMRSDR